MNSSLLRDNNKKISSCSENTSSYLKNEFLIAGGMDKYKMRFAAVEVLKRAALPVCLFTLWTVTLTNDRLLLQKKITLNGHLVPVFHISDFWMIFN